MPTAFGTPNRHLHKILHFLPVKSCPDFKSNAFQFIWHAILFVRGFYADNVQLVVAPNLLWLPAFTTQSGRSRLRLCVTNGNFRQYCFAATRARADSRRRIPCSCVDARVNCRHRLDVQPMRFGNVCGRRRDGVRRGM